MLAVVTHVITSPVSAVLDVFVIANLSSEPDHEVPPPLTIERVLIL